MCEKLKPRHLEILKDMVTYTVPLEIGFFEKKFNKSARTIRYDINELKEICQKYGVEIRYQTKKGFSIPASQKMRCSELLVAGQGKEKQGFMLDGDEEKYQKLFLYFFTCTASVTAEQAAEQFYISRSTLLRLIGKMEQFYKGKVKLAAKKAGGYELQGDELILRRIGADILAKQFKGSYTPQDWYLLIPEPLKGFVGLQMMIQLANGIKKMNARYNVWISNRAFLNLLSYCVIRNYRYYYQNVRQVERAQSLSPYAKDLLKEISYPGDWIDVCDGECMEEILALNGIAVKGAVTQEERLKSVLKEMMALAAGEGADLGKFNTISLYEDIYGHLKNSLCIGKTHHEDVEENFIVIQEVRDNYEAFYRLAEKCTEYLERELAMTFTETEICYIAIYLYKNCSPYESKQKNVLIVCATGKGLSNLLAIRVAKVFPMLKIVGQASPYQLTGKGAMQNVDFVISTVPLNFSRPPVVKISAILSAEDIQRIEEFLAYGEMLDEIPLKQRDHASFTAKADPFVLEGTGQCSRKELTNATNILSKLILTLLEYTSKFPERYKMSQDALLGLIIHMSMAIPRWFEGRKEERDTKQYEEEMERIREAHKEVYEVMEQYFELVEQSLRVRIVIEEKMAFFLYIIKEV